MSRFIDDEVSDPESNGEPIDLTQDSDEEKKIPKSKKQKRGFRLNAKSVFLTYPQCNLSKQDLKEALVDMKLPIFACAIAQERHEDGSPHLHCLLVFNKKVDFSDARKFDVNGFHPNIQATRNQQASLMYLCKDDPNPLIENLDMFPNPVGFQKRKADFDAWVLFQQTRKLKVPESIVAPDGRTTWLPNHNHRQRHWWIIAPPNWGKTHWLNCTLGGRKLYCPKQNDKPFDDYAGEQLIIFDDYRWSNSDIHMLIDTCNVWNIRKPVPGLTRYVNRYWPIGQSRFIVVLANEVPNSWDLDQRFTTRFNVIDVTNLPQYVCNNPNCQN